MLKIRLIFLVPYLLITGGNCIAQFTNIWYFGTEAGVSFNPQAGNTIPYSISNSAMTANEGTATICDQNGKILFYTNGETIYNKNHVVMQNGSGLLGHNSSFQGVLIVPVPGNDSIYYVFTTDAIERNFSNGYRYSIVNLMRNGGLGEVISKNNLLYAPGTERLTAARHANGADTWIITNDLNSNVFRSYLVNCTGLQTAPVVSISGEVLNKHDAMPIGSLKVSPDGKQLCQTHFPQLDGLLTENFFQLFSFDNNTGVISNPKKIVVTNNRYYAPEFSPDSKLLYVTKIQDNTIDQFDVAQTSVAQITASRISIPAATGFFGLQIAPDNKIYAARNNFYLSVISNPNTIGSGCNFELDKIHLNGFSGLSLPNYINDIAFNSVINHTVLDSCVGTVQFSSNTTLGGTLSYHWDFGDGQSSALQNPVHAFPTNNQFYTVKVKITSLSGCGSVERSTNILAGGSAVNAAFSFVSKCDSGYVRFVNESLVYPDSGIQYIWNFGDGNFSTDKNPVHSFPGPGNYNVSLKIKTSTACLDDSVTHILNLQLLDITASSDQTIEIGQSVQLSVAGGGSKFQWLPAQWLNDPTIANPIATPQQTITYTIKVTNDAGCMDMDSVTIKVQQADSVYVPTAFTPNNDGLNDTFKPLIGSNYSLEKFSVFNRWGQEVFSTVTKDVGWNGKVRNTLQGNGMYVWYITARNKNGQLLHLKGTVMLIR